MTIQGPTGVIEDVSTGRGPYWPHDSHSWGTGRSASSQFPSSGRFFDTSPGVGLVEANQRRDDAESSSRNLVEERDHSFDPEPYRPNEKAAEENYGSPRHASHGSIFRTPPTSAATTYSTEGLILHDKVKLVADAASFAESVQGRELTEGFMEVDTTPRSPLAPRKTESHHEEEKKQESSSDDEVILPSTRTMLLSMPEDKAALSETLCVVREVSRPCLYVPRCVRNGV